MFSLQSFSVSRFFACAGLLFSFEKTFCNSPEVLNFILLLLRRTSLGVSSPTESCYQSSPDKRLSSSGSECSSPTTSNTASPPPASANPLEKVDVLSPSSLHKQFAHISRDGIAQLQIITQPEQQHRARYQTEGSRGAVKDRGGNGFPVVKLNGYNKSTTLQVRIPMFTLQC